MTFFQWSLIFIGVVLFLWLRMRKSGQRNDLTERQISIAGTRLSTWLSTETPLECLLVDDVVFGESFKDKDLPELPHSEKCRCKQENYVARSREWFIDSTKSQQWESDIGALDRNQARFLKYQLLLRLEVDEEKSRSLIDTLGGMTLDEDFKTKVLDYLKRKDDEKESI